jgi:hypothetical protein
LAQSRGSSNGPDVTDIAQAMEAIASYHEVELTILATRNGSRGDGDLKLTVLAESRTGSRGGASSKVSRSAWYPNQQSKTLEGAIFKLLYETDLDCGAMWSQTELFKS